MTRPDATSVPLARPVPDRPGDAPPSRPRRRRRALLATLAVLLTVALAGATVWYFVFRDTAPAEVSLGSATAALDAAGSSGSATTRGSATDASADGTWTVDQDLGDFAAFTSSFVGYRVQEQLAGIGAKTAVGRTPDVTGTVVIDGGTVTTVEIEVDMTTLVSDDSRRDGAIQNQALETRRYTTATFELTEPIEVGDVAEGETVTVPATGELTLHGVTRTVTIELSATLDDGVLAVTGSLDVEFADYDIDPPTSFAVLSVEDHGVLELQLFLTK
jgi:polyisoprenoid-binding protein YceI